MYQKIRKPPKHTPQLSAADNQLNQTNMKQKRDEHDNELIEFSFAICIPDKGNENTAADTNSAPTEEERKAAATAPVLFTVSQSVAIAKAAHKQQAATAATGNEKPGNYLNAIAKYAEAAARSIADELINIAFRPTATNKANLVYAIAEALHIASIAARNGISTNPQRYHTDYNANHLTGMFVAAIKAILNAHDDGREEDEVYIASLYDDAAHTVRNAAQRVPIRHADAADITTAINAMNEAVTNL